MAKPPIRSIGPELVTAPPGPTCRKWSARARAVNAPMGPALPPDAAGLVYQSAQGSYVTDVDGNRYVDLAAGFGALLLGHSHPRVVAAIAEQASVLLHALGDVYPSREKIELCERLSALLPELECQVIIGQSGADAITAALKTATLYTGRAGWLAMGGSYHGLSYGPLAVTSLRKGYSAPFARQLNPHVSFCPYPQSEQDRSTLLQDLESRLARGDIAAVIVEPVLGRGGCCVPPDGMMRQLSEVAHRHGSLVIADEIWTGLGRTGAWLRSSSEGMSADLITLGKGLGGGLPISACLGSREVMAAWQQPAETVHTSTFAGSPLASRAALVTLDVLREEQLVERSAVVGARWLELLRSRLLAHPRVREVRGVGLMVGVDLGEWRGGASVVQRSLVERGFITTTGGGAREVLVLTPALDVPEAELEAFVAELWDCLQALTP
jgi:4-aminobutyrate aminotransferase/(S)-3-amino-2-methylpropionate transaminase